MHAAVGQAPALHPQRQHSAALPPPRQRADVAPRLHAHPQPVACARALVRACSGLLYRRLHRGARRQHGLQLLSTLLSGLNNDNDDDDDDDDDDGVYDI